jgi:hypothetical protein
MAAWDARWAALSLKTRRLYLTKVRPALYNGAIPPLHDPGAFPADIVVEWRAAGLIHDATIGRKTGFVVAPAALGFTQRLQTLREFHLLDEARGSSFERYVYTNFFTYHLDRELGKVVQKQTGLDPSSLGGNLLELFVKRRRWPGWVADFLKDPLAGPLLDAVEKAGAVPVSSLPGLLPGHHPAAVRETLDKLVNYLALVEDVDPATLDVLVGLLPCVAADRRKAAQHPGERPLGAVVAEDVAAEGGPLVPDLRAVLLEVAGQPPRLKQNLALYQKEEARFEGLFDPPPDWLPGAYDPTAHLHRLWTLAAQAGFTHAAAGVGDAVVLDLTPKGRGWLAKSLEEQYAELFEMYRTPQRDAYWGGADDAFFLGSRITAVPVKPGKRKQPVLYSHKALTPEERLPLRDALYRLFAELPVGTFYALDDFLAWAVAGARNPLLLGGESSRVMVRKEMRFLPPLEEVLEETGRELLKGLLEQRLVGLGCVQLGRAAGRLLVARRPRLDVFFGKAKPAPAPPAEATRVVVQPDFSVIVIGLNPAPAADLAPFCDRERGRSSQGSLTLRITRESVMRALAAGLPPEQVMERLQKHASTPLPANVATEVRDWCGWVRRVSMAPATLLRCPDADAASRALGALGKHAERVGDTVLALAADGLTPALRQRLQSQGILIEGAKRRRR